MSTVAIVNRQKAETFGAQPLTTLNNGVLCLTISAGHRTRLFDAMRDFPPASSEEIAERTGLNERYGREWLAALMARGVVEFQPFNQCSFLPPEHADYLTRAVGKTISACLPSTSPALAA